MFFPIGTIIAAQNSMNIAVQNSIRHSKELRRQQEEKEKEADAEDSDG